MDPAEPVFAVGLLNAQLVPPMQRRGLVQFPGAQCRRPTRTENVTFLATKSFTRNAFFLQVVHTSHPSGPIQRYFGKNRLGSSRHLTFCLRNRFFIRRIGLILGTEVYA